MLGCPAGWARAEARAPCRPPGLSPAHRAGLWFSAGYTQPPSRPSACCQRWAGAGRSCGSLVTPSPGKHLLCPSERALGKRLGGWDTPGTSSCNTAPLSCCRAPAPAQHMGRALDGHQRQVNLPGRRRPQAGTLSAYGGPPTGAGCEAAGAITQTGGGGRAGLQGWTPRRLLMGWMRGGVLVSHPATQSCCLRGKV